MKKAPLPACANSASGLCRWVRGVRTRHAHALTHHPHHYATAAGLTVFLFFSGHWEIAAVQLSWLYALVENVATAGELDNHA